MKTYIAIAYQFGWTNSTNYLVAASTERDEVIEAARIECENRAGKYGVLVIAFDSDPAVEQEHIAYFASRYGEEEPRDNPRINVFRRLGHKVCLAVETGAVDLPDPDDPGTLKSYQVEVPQWIRDAKAYIETFELGMEQMLRKVLSSRYGLSKSGLGKKKHSDKAG